MDEMRGQRNVPLNREKFYSVGAALDLVGTVGYGINPTSGLVTIAVEEIENDSLSGTSGNIVVAIIATTSPIDPVNGLTYYLVGRLNLAPLAWNFHYTDINTTVPLRASPPDGVYYISMLVMEQEAGCTGTGELAGYCADDWTTFSSLRVVSGGVWQPIGTTPPPAPTTAAVEYFNAGFGHYFVTADPAEIAGLDAGAYNFAFQRTGQQWKVWTSGTGYDVCRFFTTPGTFGTKSSHFYTAVASECNGLKLNPNWIYEKVAGKVALPTGGVCPAGTQILYRLYNQGQTGAPNHRYTTSLAIRAQMIAQGFAPEDPNNACVPL